MERRVNFELKGRRVRLGYNTNGFSHHRLEDALAIIAELGYECVAITLDHYALNPYTRDWAREVDDVRRRLERLGLTCVVETGARFLLDPRRKHQPTLLSMRAVERDRRLDFLRRAVDVAAGLGAEAVSFWSGTPDACENDAVVFSRLRDGCLRLADYAADRQVRLAFEPEPGMFIARMDQFAQLHQAAQHPLFGLTLDLGHLHCLGEEPIARQVLDWRDWLWNVHVDDARRGVHDHLPLGEGEIDFPPIFAALSAAGYAGGLYVELSRHSHDAVEVARKSIAFLRELRSKANLVQS